MDEAYKTWKAQPTSENLRGFLDKAEPVIKSALNSYAGGNEALKSQARILAVEAARKYDPKQGTKLKTYLMTQLQPLSRVARARGSITQVPERVSIDLYHLRQAEQTFNDEKGRPPSDTELIDRLGFSRKRLLHLRNFMSGDVSETGVSSPESGAMLPGVARADPAQIMMEYVHHDLDPLDQMILEHKTGLYGKPVLSTNDIAIKLKLSPAAVSQRAKKVSQRVLDLQNATEDSL